MTKLETLPPANLTLTLKSFTQSPIGKKLLTGMTGIGLVTFLIIHMLGNLLLLESREAFNAYAYGLESVKPLLLSIELLLTLVVIVHAYLGMQIYIKRRKARPVDYDTLQSAGDPSHQSWSSRNMIWTGLSLALFLIWHLITFKFGTVYTTTLHGESVRDLAQLVIETFQNPLYTLSYTLILIVLFHHLRHGISSALQSVGLMLSDLNSAFYLWCHGIGWVILLGFLIPPITILGGWIV